MKSYLPFIITVFLCSCHGNQNGSTIENTTTDTATDSVSQAEPAPTVSMDTIASPGGLTKLGEASGDLDKDGQPETVIVYDSQRESKDELGTERELHIFKSNNGKWELWHKSIGAVLPSQGGGVMGDPFMEVKVENGSIVLGHAGGSRYKWNYTHRFRYQDGDWKLIGSTTVNGTPCEYWETVDYNLSTGKITYEKETEDCSESEENPKMTKTTKSFTNKLKTLPSMDGFEPGGHELKLKGLEDSIYF